MLSYRSPHSVVRTEIAVLSSCLVSCLVLGQTNRIESLVWSCDLARARVALTAIAVTNSAVTDMTHFMFVARGVAVGVDSWDLEGRHEAQCQGHSGPSLLTTPNERLYTVRLSQYQATD